uniref:Uncharacterized protein n=1 Tax=Oryza brachyantha TaxID=4533 RepID=J3LC44_ORYBR
MWCLCHRVLGWGGDRWGEDIGSGGPHHLQFRGARGYRVKGGMWYGRGGECVALAYFIVIMAARRTVRGYAPLPTENRHDNSLNDDVDLQFAYTPKSFRKIPWKSIALALFLLLLGSSLLSLSYFIFTGHIEGDNSQAYGLLFLGILAFLPGFYETRVAYYSWRGAPGYTFASIPDY